MNKIFSFGSIFLCSVLVPYGLDLSISYADSLEYHSTIQRSMGVVGGLDGIQSVAVSPDGNTIYIAAQNDHAVSVFSRDLVTGDLTFVETIQDDNGGIINGLRSAWGVTVSPEGTHVYVAAYGDDAVNVFSRNPITGVLAFVQVVKNHDGNADGIDGVLSVTVSPDGNHVYVTAYVDDAVAVFSRNPTTGILTFVQVVKDGDNNGNVDGLNGARYVTVSPDGNHVYAVADMDDAVTVFSRDPVAGTLTFVQVVKDGDNGNVDGLDRATSVTVSPDNSHVYVASLGDSAVAIFSRDQITGELTFVQVVKDGDDGNVDGLHGAKSVVVSPDGSHVYVAGASDEEVAVFDRNPTTGILTFTQVISDRVYDATTIALSPDGMQLYVTAPNRDSVTVFGRNISSGTLRYTGRQKNGFGNGTHDLLSPSAVASSYDNRHIYVTGQDANAVVFLERNSISGELTAVGSIPNGGIVEGLGGAASIAVSPDDVSVYVAGYNDNAVAAFSRNTGTGNLQFIEAYTDGEVGVDGLDGAKSVTVSPDSRYTYIAGYGDDAIAIFSRNLNSGELTFAQVIKDGDDGIVDGLDGARSVTVSPDNKYIYVAGDIDSAVAVFSRDLVNGELAFIQVIKDGDDGIVDGLDGAASVTVSPDNQHVYVAGNTDAAVAVFSRNTETGMLDFIEVKSNGSDDVKGLAGATSVAVSPDGSHVYLAGNQEDAIAVFNRNSQTGTLNFLEVKRNGAGGVKELEEPSAVIVSPDGNYLFATASHDNAVTLFEIIYSAQDLSMERQKWDANNDNVIGLEEAIHALQVTSGN